MAISFFRHDDALIFEYQASRNNNAVWVDENLEDNEQVRFRGVFHFIPKDKAPAESLGFDENDQARYFSLGTSLGEYYLIRADVLNLKHDLKISRELEIKKSTFIAEDGESIFKKIDSVIEQPIIVGGDEAGAIPLDEFENLLKNFPTKTEIKHYVGARIQRVLGDYFETIQDSELKLKNHLERKNKVLSNPKPSLIAEYEIAKFEYYHARLLEMLDTAESYVELDWQNKIIEIILVLFPKYISVLKNVAIKDFYSDKKKTKNRFIDLALVDANGNLDIIEIKRPFDSAVLSKAKYRDNHTPHKELSGAIMQAEKYLFHLSKWGVEGEKILNKKHSSSLLNEISLKITNPKILLIIGRSSEFCEQQLFDFELIKRKYANVIDIITYDDLLERLKLVLENFKKIAGNH